ncbi:MAG: ribosomal protein S18-alanine N-acetyltransferase [Clostridia bacterium]|nr:ribosomal protein S18-alanine N-acetyltransferase [Clostridia bacterium]
MEFSRISEKYIAAAALTEAAYLDTAWSENQIREALERDDTLYLIATENGELCAVLSCVFSLYEGMIENLAVDENHRRKGAALGLISLAEAEAICRNAEQLSLEVASRNAAAVSLYEKAGFVKAGIRKGFYRKQNDDAIVMIKEIKK